jgi:hypothetical protein
VVALLGWTRLSPRLLYHVRAPVICLRFMHKRKGLVLVLHIVIESYRLACGVMCGVLRLLGDMHAVRLPHSWEPHNPIPGWSDSVCILDWAWIRPVVFRLHFASPDVNVTFCAAQRSLSFFSPALQTRHRRILLRAYTSVHYLLRLMFAISASFTVQPCMAIGLSESFEECGSVPSLESTKTCGLAFQRHVCDTNAHPA